MAREGEEQLQRCQRVLEELDQIGSMLQSHATRKWPAWPTLLAVPPHHRTASVAMHILFPHRCHIPRRVRLFADWIGELARAAMA